MCPQIAILFRISNTQYVDNQTKQNIEQLNKRNLKIAKKTKSNKANDSENFSDFYSGYARSGNSRDGTLFENSAIANISKIKKSLKDNSQDLFVR